MTNASKLHPHSTVHVNRYQMVTEGKTYMLDHYMIHPAPQMELEEQTLTFSDQHGRMCTLTTENARIFPLTLFTETRDHAPDATKETLIVMLQNGLDLLAEKDATLLYPDVYTGKKLQPDIRAAMITLNTGNRTKRADILAEQEKERRAKAAEMAANQKALEKQREKDAKKAAKKQWEERQKRDAQKKNGLNP